MNGHQGTYRIVEIKIKNGSSLVEKELESGSLDLSDENDTYEKRLSKYGKTDIETSWAEGGIINYDCLRSAIYN